MDAPIPAMQAQVRAALASQRAQSSMTPVKLIASDGSEIIIDKRAALVSGTIKAMLAGPGARRAARVAFAARALSPSHRPDPAASDAFSTGREPRRKLC